jgi:hypothetical protein
MEWKLFDGDVPHVSTFEFHEHRDRAPHLEQSVHLGRLTRACDFIMMNTGGVSRWVDLGCGDGGLLMLGKSRGLYGIGYDFQPSNAMGWNERGVFATSLNFVEHWDLVVDADVYSITECLEHLADPHQMVRQIHERNACIVASSPWTEHAGSHDECHAWAWDQQGYAQLLTDAGFTVDQHVTDGMFQIIVGTP